MACDQTTPLICTVGRASADTVAGLARLGGRVSAVAFPAAVTPPAGNAISPATTASRPGHLRTPRTLVTPGRVWKAHTSTEHDTVTVGAADRASSRRNRSMP